MKNFIQRTAVAAALAFFGLLGTAQAQKVTARAVPAQVSGQRTKAPKAPALRTPAQTKEALLDAAKRSDMPHRLAADGKVLFNPHE